MLIQKLNVTLADVAQPNGIHIRIKSFDAELIQISISERLRAAIDSHAKNTNTTRTQIITRLREEIHRAPKISGLQGLLKKLEISCADFMPYKASEISIKNEDNKYDHLFIGERLHLKIERVAVQQGKTKKAILQQMSHELKSLNKSAKVPIITKKTSMAKSYANTI